VLCFGLASPDKLHLKKADSDHAYQTDERLQSLGRSQGRSFHVAARFDDFVLQTRKILFF
jgi:hypothetical protein